MSCYRPMMGILRDNEGGCKHYDITTMNSDLYDELSPSGTAIQIPCGKCLGCRLDYSKNWSDRLMMESKLYNDNYFITLTYEDDYIPNCFIDLEDGSEMDIYTLKMEDFQKFMKRLRDYFHRKCKSEGLNEDDYKIRYFACGEYGNQGRPHYHAILFNCRLDDVSDKIGAPRNKYGNKPQVSETLEKIWPYGFVELGPVTPETCGYVARYTMKKAFKDRDRAEPEEREKEFVLMSRKPGIGRAFFDQHPGMFDTGVYYLGTECGSVKITMPRYFKKISDTPEQRLSRKVAGNLSRRAKNQQTDLDYRSRLINEEKTKQKITQSLKRNL